MRTVPLAKIKSAVDQAIKDLVETTVDGLMGGDWKDGVHPFDWREVAKREIALRTEIYSTILQAIRSNGFVVPELADVKMEADMVSVALFRESQIGEV